MMALTFAPTSIFVPISGAISTFALAASFGKEVVGGFRRPSPTLSWVDFGAGFHPLPLAGDGPFTIPNSLFQALPSTQQKNPQNPLSRRRNTTTT